MNCDCESVRFYAEGSPVENAYCHCADCRDFYSTPVLAATAWSKSALRVVSGDEFVSNYQHPHKQLSKFSCVKCGDTLFGTNRLGMNVIPNKQICRNSELAKEMMRPDFHLFYRQRVIDIKDTLTKYLDGRNGEVFSG